MAEYVTDWQEHYRLKRERVVRCRDCKFALVSKDAISCHGPIQAAGIAMCAGKLVKPDGFCSWGEGCER